MKHSYAQALIVYRVALDAAQQANDALATTQALKRGFETDVAPILQGLSVIFAQNRPFRFFLMITCYSQLQIGIWVSAQLTPPYRQEVNCVMLVSM